MEYGSASGTSVAIPDMAPDAARIDDRVPLLLPKREDILKGSRDQLHLLVCLNRLKLATWRVSGNNTQQQMF